MYSTRYYKAYTVEKPRNGRGHGIGVTCRNNIYGIGECASVLKGANKNKELRRMCQKAFVQCVHSKAKAKRKIRPKIKIPKIPIPPSNNTIPPATTPTPTTPTTPVDPNDPSIPEPTILDSIFKSIEELIAAVIQFFSGENKTT